MQVQAPAGREMPADAQHELARLGIAVVGPAASNLVTFPLGQVNVHVRLWMVQSLPSIPDLPAKTSANLLWMAKTVPSTASRICLSGNMHYTAVAIGSDR